MEQKTRINKTKINSLMILTQDLYYRQISGKIGKVKRKGKKA